ncbi:MAG: hypothetical protein ACPGJV_05070 [Bacteriovoracaceae bacterium]
MKPCKKIALLTLLVFMSSSALAINRVSRLGLGYTGQFATGLDAISFKIHKSRNSAFGGAFGYNSNDTGGYAGGLKFYRNFFEEPQLHFYGAAFAGLLNQKYSNGESETGFQIDVTLGAEFHFVGLDSLAFSVETGVSAHKVSDFEFGTTGSQFIIGSFHFYL